MTTPGVILPDAEWRTRPGLAALVTALGDARFVGGSVRDGLLGLSVSDIDMATPLAPDAVMARLKAAKIKAVPTGLAHGTVTAVTEGGPVEVTTLRRDVETDGRHAKVAFTADWREDAARRDFTINALSADPATGEVFDYFGGLADLDARRVRFIGDPFARIAEDHLRILRLFRFHARFGSGPPDADAYAAAKVRANDLMALSRERIASELLKLLASDAPVDAVRAMLDGGILKPVLPEIESADALARLVAREGEFGMAGDPVRRLAALIGAQPDVAANIAARLKLSKARTRQLTIATDTRSAPSPRAIAYRVGNTSAVDRVLLGDGTAADIAALTDWTPPKLPISGGDLIARGLKAGPTVARTLAAIETEWVAAGFPEGSAWEGIIDRAFDQATAST